MIESLNIRNYRLFKELNLPKFARVNLITGKNNTGKSALLEAVRLYAKSIDGGLLREILEYRQENREDPTGISKGIVRHLFYQRQLPDCDEDGIILESNKKFHIRTVGYAVRENADGEVTRKILSRQPVLSSHTSDFLDEDIEIYLAFEDSEQQVHRLFPIAIASDRLRRLYSPPFRRSKRKSSQYCLC
ncbi:MAG: AAA family ATPase [Deinococcales bacterium]